jgi:RNA polymerase sigma-70 factor (ECF subfamily)
VNQLDRADSIFERLTSSSQSESKLQRKVSAYFDQWREPVFRYLSAAFGNTGIAEDVTQEAFLQLYRSLETGESISNVKAWVFRVARNMALNQVKRENFFAPMDESTLCDLVQMLPDPSLDPEQTVIRRQKLERINAALGTLTPVERHCLYLRAQGLRYREIAEIADLTTTTVAETLYRVVAKLAKS